VAAGLQLVAAVNHWPLAVETHRANHPKTLHLCQDAALMDPRTLPAFDVLLASPECRGHCEAKGKEQPHHDASRATAWCVVNVAEVCRPRFLVVENVPEMVGWALFPQWQAALEKLGYAIEQNIFDAADFGVPQNRVRMFVIGALDQLPPRTVKPGLNLCPVRTILDMHGGKWSPIKGHCEKTVKRAANGRRQFGESFVMPYYGSGSGETGRSLDRPIGTITTRDRWALVHGRKMRMLTAHEYKLAMGFPVDYRVQGSRAQQIHQLGNAVPPPLMKSICQSLVTAAGVN